jgi:hypothetical protein
MAEKESAYHEAGHAAIGYLHYGERIGYIVLRRFIEDGLRKSGRVHWAEKKLFAIECPGIRVAGDIAVRIGEIEITLETAGIETQTATHWSISFPGETGQFWRDPKIRYETKTAIYEKTVRLLRKQWPAVEALAKALLKEKTLQGPEAEEILDQEISK